MSNDKFINFTKEKMLVNVGSIDAVQIDEGENLVISVGQNEYVFTKYKFNEVIEAIKLRLGSCLLIMDY